MQQKTHPLKQIGEFGLIDRIRTWFGEETSDVLGIGDDCTVIPQKNGPAELITTDLLIEDTHFLLEKITPEDLGHKSLAVNLSDIAAMGGKPKHFWLSIGLTEKTDPEWLERFFTGMRDLARKHDVRLMGGDTTRSRQHLIINILVSGEADPPQLRYRSGARPGDIVFVTGQLGDSGGGLQLLLNDRHQTGDPAERALIRAHNRPDAAVNEGAWLGRQSEVHALIDVSDGIASDAGHIANRSGVSIELELTDIPVSPDLLRIAETYGWNPMQLACSAGEDYVLLGTCDASRWQPLLENYRQATGGELYAIGTVAPFDAQTSEAGPDRRKTRSLLEGGEVRFVKNGKPADYTESGFDHFKSP